MVMAPLPDADLRQDTPAGERRRLGHLRHGDHHAPTRTAPSPGATRSTSGTASHTPAGRLSLRPCPRPWGTAPVPEVHRPLQDGRLGRRTTTTADLAAWKDTPIYSYLQAGGNVLLLTRHGDTFLADPSATYLGITWHPDGTITDCISTYLGADQHRPARNAEPGGRLQPDAWERRPRSVQGRVGHNPELGARRDPAAGRGRNLQPARRPLRVPQRAALPVEPRQPADEHRVHPQSPLPSGSSGGSSEGGTARLSLDRPPRILQGRTPRSDSSCRRTDRRGSRSGMCRAAGCGTLWNGPASAGAHTLTWNGRDQVGHPVSSGMYYLRLEAAGSSLEEKLLRLR